MDPVIINFTMPNIRGTTKGVNRFVRHRSLKKRKEDEDDTTIVDEGGEEDLISNTTSTSTPTDPDVSNSSQITSPPSTTIPTTTAPVGCTSPSSTIVPTTMAPVGGTSAVGHLSLAMSLYVTPESASTTKELVAGPSSFRYSFLKAPLTQWAKDFVCAQKGNRITRLIAVDDDDGDSLASSQSTISWEDQCRNNPLPMPPANEELILGDDIDLDFSEHGLYGQHDIATTDQAMFSSWNWTFSVHQWGNSERYPNVNFVQSILNEQIKSQSLSVELPWQSVELSISGHELETFRTNHTSITNKTKVPGANSAGNSTNENTMAIAPFSSSSSDAKIVQSIGVIMLILLIIVEIFISRAAKKESQRRQASSEDMLQKASFETSSVTHASPGTSGAASPTGPEEEPLSSPKPRRVTLRTAEGVEELLLITRRSIEVMPTLPSSTLIMCIDSNVDDQTSSAEDSDDIEGGRRRTSMGSC